ncbi:MAG: hypothetical protein K0U86_02755 [Planctomycetes bacterium]|nr:hypothetical protein [Planctomycetota bacterium]MCH9776285.1 hypothetical protein [Planctomycetota bacterium]MCH9792087.1 hypothetical protein [Planctomycetota bacterium]
MTHWITTISLGSVLAITSVYWMADDTHSKTIDSTYAVSVKHVQNDTDYEGVPQAIESTMEFVSTNHACDKCSSKDPALHHKHQCQSHNLKQDNQYRGIEVGGNRWIKMACDEAHQSVKEGGGPFGAVVVQIDDTSNKVIRFWRCRNQVTKSTPTVFLRHT